MASIFLDGPWRVTTDIVKIYCAHPTPRRRWRHVNRALSAYLQTSELLECPSPPTHGQGRLPPLAPTDWPAGASRTVPLAATERRALCLPFMFRPSSRGPARKRDTGKFIADISGPFAIYKEEAEWDIWSYQSLLSTFRTAATPGWRPGSPGYAQDIRPRPKDALLGLLRGNILSLVVKNIQKYLLSKLFDFWYSGAIYHENDSS